ncbi:23122_t:CDS:2, partial [Racocetra persica]
MGISSFIGKGVSKTIEKVCDDEDAKEVFKFVGDTLTGGIIGGKAEEETVKTAVKTIDKVVGKIAEATKIMSQNAGEAFTTIGRELGR